MFLQRASLADAIPIARSVQHHINVQVISVRRIRTRTKHGREPSACSCPNRANDFSCCLISIGLYGNEFAVGKLKTRNVDRFAYCVLAELPNCGSVAVTAFVSWTGSHSSQVCGHAAPDQWGNQAA